MAHGGTFHDAEGIKDPRERFEIKMLFFEISRQQRGIHPEAGHLGNSPLPFQIK